MIQNAVNIYIHNEINDLSVFYALPRNVHHKKPIYIL